jgi:hypothetical protein
MRKQGFARRVLRGGIVAAGLVATAAPAQAPGLGALGALERGQWQLRGSDGAVRTLCVHDAAQFVQQRHRGAHCARTVLASDATSATVHYACAGTGHGRTSISLTTPRSVHIESQGLEGGVPFALEVVARRVGSCATAALAR